MPVFPRTRVVLDTNVLVSSLIAEHGFPHQILDAWLEDRYALRAVQFSHRTLLAPVPGAAHAAVCRFWEGFRSQDAPGTGAESLGELELNSPDALVTSLYLIEELIHVLSYPRIAKRLRLDEDELAAILAALLSKAEVTPGRLHLPGVTRDPKDDAVVACAKEGDADYIISGDQDLLVLGEYEGIRVVAPCRFVEILQEEQ